MTSENNIKKPEAPEAPPTEAATKKKPPQKAENTTAVEEIGGPKGPEPTRYGDWEQKGRCTDF